MAKILLVEDDKSLREIYGLRLEAEGYTIISAGDGEEALAVAIKERPDLIVSDVMMPKISGFDMLDILRSTTETKDIKVIMMTALSSEDQRARGESLGANRYLVKSQVGIEDVVRTVHEVLADGIGGPAPAPVAAPTPAPVVAPEPLVAPVPSAPSPEPFVAPTPVVDTIPAPIAPAPVPVEPLNSPVSTPAFDPLSVTPLAAPAPVIASAPVATPVAEAPLPQPVVAPVPEPLPTPVAEVPPAPVAETAAAATNPFVPQTPVAPAPTPAVSLPEPTAPFSSNPPASLGDRIINPLPSADELIQTPTDIASQMNQELSATVPQTSPTPVAAPAPQPALPPFPPQPSA